MPRMTSGQVLGHADLAGDLVAEVLHVVAHAAGAVGAEVGQVLAQLAAVDAGGGGELLARAGADAALGEPDEGPQVERQPRHGGLGDAAGAAAGPAGSTACRGARGQPYRVRDLAGAVRSRVLAVSGWAHRAPQRVCRRAAPATFEAAGAVSTLGVCERENKTVIRPWAAPVTSVTPASCRAGARGPSGEQRSPQPDRVDPPEVVLTAVDEGHGDLLAVAGEQVGVRGDVDLLPALSQLGADRLHDLPGVVAEVAPRLGRRAAPVGRRSSRAASLEDPGCATADALPEPAAGDLAGHGARQRRPPPRPARAA